MKKQQKDLPTTAKVVGDKVLFFGDLHMSSTFEGQHKAYLQECYENMEIIKDICDKEKPSAIVFAGDINGVNEQNIRDRQFFMRELQWFTYLNSLTNGNVYSVKGNHDVGDFTDFDFLVGLNLLKNPRYLDFYVIDENTGNEKLEVRFHLVNYGYEHAKLNLTAEGDLASNVVFGHNDYYIDGVTNWYSAKNGVELSKLDNFCGVDLVFSGHIHIPSNGEICYTNLPDGNTIGLFYPGSPSRVADRYDNCWYVSFYYSKESGATEYNASLMGLRPASEIFYPKEDFELGEGSEEEMIDREQSEKLTALVKEIIEGRLTTGDIVGQIKAVPGVSDEVKEIAIRYYNMAIGEERK